MTLTSIFTLSCMLALTAAAERPLNLVVVLTDDQGYQDVGFNGCPDIPSRLDPWKEGLVAPIAPGLGSWTFDP